MGKIIQTLPIQIVLARLGQEIQCGRNDRHEEVLEQIVSPGAAADEAEIGPNCISKYQTVLVYGLL